eukprot:gb/GFBE01049657.1/.p1 GENE.gb/GFBE01049657.1/~~gb/GFBE01049657.1/.p1  ORF type:complete len:780 (+),score=185.92 gb/GFBE01049657.1/:1-2340(+)
MACVLLRVLTAFLILSATFSAEPLRETSCDEDDRDTSMLLQQSAMTPKLHVATLQLPQGSGSGRNESKALLQNDTEATENDPNEEDEAEKIMGVKGNSSGDLNAFWSGLVSNVVTILAVSVAFCILRFRYPQVYSDNVLQNVSPVKPADTWLSWIYVGFQADDCLDEVADSSGLDSAMMLAFINLSLRILAIIGFPSLLILGPVHALFGGAGPNVDRLSRIGMNNVIEGHSWLYYLHGLVVISVCVTVKSCVYSAQSTFLERRFRWLKKLGAPRSRTVLVQGIPEDFRLADKLREFFSTAIHNEAVDDVFMVQRTEKLESLTVAMNVHIDSKRQAVLEFEKSGQRPMHRPMYVGTSVDSIDYYTQELQKVEVLIVEERERLLRAADQLGGVNCQSAFVTFKARKHAEIALQLNYSPDAEEWVVTEAPELSTVRWHELRTSDEVQMARQFVGYAAVFGLYVAFMPVTIGTTNLATGINLGPLWASLAPTLGLTIFLSFLPTVLMLIVDTFFSLKSSQLVQEKLLVWYFWFQVIFVILVTAIGNNFISFCTSIAENPVALLSIMADQLPKATHFYMNFLVVQWSTHFINLLRYINLVKFLGLKALYTEEEAKIKSEPEAQDYYGFGSRSARWTINLLIGIIFGTLCPAIAVLAFMNFIACKVVYGYLIVVAEQRKPDVGGHFWVTNLRHVLQGTAIYAALMTGVLLDRAPNCIPGGVALVSMFFVAHAAWQFDRRFRWQDLPYVAIMYKDEDLDSQAGDPSIDSYEQPELKQARSIASSKK